MQLRYIQDMQQARLFGIPPRLPTGMLYQPDFITHDEEAALLDEIVRLPLAEAKYKQYTAKRRIMSYGASYDFSSNELLPAGPIPLFLIPCVSALRTGPNYPLLNSRMRSSQSTRSERNSAGI